VRKPFAEQKAIFLYAGRRGRRPLQEGHDFYMRAADCRPYKMDAVLCRGGYYPPVKRSRKALFLNEVCPFGASDVRAARDVCPCGQMMCFLVGNDKEAFFGNEYKNIMKMCKNSVALQKEK